MPTTLTICFDKDKTELSLDGVPWASVSNGNVEITGPGPATVRLPGITYYLPESAGTTPVGLHLLVSKAMNAVANHQRQLDRDKALNIAAGTFVEYP